MSKQEVAKQCWVIRGAAERALGVACDTFTFALSHRSGREQNSTYLLTYLLTYYDLLLITGLDHNYCRNHPNISSFAFESISSSDVSYPTGIIGIQQTAYNQTRDAP